MCNNQSLIYAINAEQYQWGTRNNLNPIILVYNGAHFESLDTCSDKDETEAIDLVESIKLGEYKLEQKDIQYITRIAKTNKKDVDVEIISQ